MLTLFWNKGGLGTIDKLIKDNYIGYIGEIVVANSIAGRQNYVSIRFRDKRVYSFLKSHLGNTVTFYLAGSDGSTTLKDCKIFHLNKDTGSWSSQTMEDGFEANLIPGHMDYNSKFYDDEFRKIQKIQERDNKINELGI